MAGRGGYVGSSGDTTREIVDMYVGTPTGKKQVAAAYVGTTSGNKLWYARTPDLGFISAGASSTSQIGLSWTPLGPTSKFTYNLYRNGGLLASTGLTAYQDSGLAASTTYTYQVNAVRNGIVADTASVAVRTQDVPAPSTFDIELRAWTSQTYMQNGTPSAYVANHVYQGYSQEGSRGIQKSTWNFSIPPYVRNCSSLSKVYMRVRIDHTYNSDYGDFGVVVHHNASQGLGSTGIIGNFRTKGAHQGTQGDCWIGEGYYNKFGDGYLDITGYPVPGSFGGRNWTVAEEFRVGGAQGLGFAASSNASHYYGHGWGVNSTADPYWWPSLVLQGTY